MNEIEILYENAGIKDKCGYICSAKGIGCNECPNKNRKFTAEKQIELIKWLADRPLPVLIGKYRGKYYFGNTDSNSKADVFDNALARRINEYWDSLTEEEKEQIRDVLK